MNKRILCAIMMVLTVALFATTGFALEERGDTLAITTDDAYETPLNEIIVGDTAADGSRSHLVYELEPNGWYALSGTINSSTFDLTIISAPRSEGDDRPVILFRQDASDWFMFQHGGDVHLEGLWIMFVLETPGGARGPWKKCGFTCVNGGTNVRFHDLVVDFNEAWWYDAGNLPDLKLKATNCLFRWSGPANNSVWAGQGFSARNAAVDSLIWQDCTWHGKNAFAIINYNSTHEFLKIDHCTMVDFTQFPLHMPFLNNAEITNNLFYNTLAAGEDAGMRNGQDPDGYPYGVINIDTITHVYVDTTDTTGQSDSSWIDMTEEATRSIKILNNNNFVSPTLISFYQEAMTDSAYDDFQYADLDFYNGFMNERTQHVFSDDASWPLFDLENTMAEDPGFVNYPDWADTLVQFAKYLYLSATDTTIQPVGFTTDPDGEPLIPTPVNTYDLSYTNSTLLTAATDGGPIGDRTWFIDGQYGAAVITDVDEARPNLNDVAEFSLSQNYPNPFNPSTTIEYNVAKAADVQLAVYNVIGQKVAVLVDEKVSPGAHKVEFDASRFSSGLYFYRLEVDSKVETKKMVLMK